MPSEDKPTPRQVIEDIREDFLIDDSGLSERAKRGAKSLQKNLNNALKLLSDDLYSNDSHFILELVQNADDNDYPSGVTPELAFALHPRQLVLANNEVGFLERNVRAICQVGESSKAASKHVHIGEKGIGFKAVFAVSNAPEIHSNGYHFRFDRTDPEHLLGYVVPHWCEPPAGISSDGTTIILPAAGEAEFDPEELGELDSRALLFLNKLRRMTLQVGSARRVYERIDRGRLSLLTTTTTDGDKATSSEQRYVRVSHVVDMTGEHSDPKRIGIEQTSLTLAFPVDRSGKALPELASHVFAFLPVQQAGFRFSIHADFLLSSSRETIHKHKNWNKALRNAIASAFVQALENFRRSESLGLTYLKYIPAANEVADPFFAEVRPAVIRLLSGETSLLSASRKWTRPSDLRQAEASFRSLFTSLSALSLFGFDYVDARVEATAALLRELGVKDVALGRILEVFKLHGEWLKVQPLEWRAQFYAYIAERKEALIADGLLKLNCLPTSKGTYVVPEATHTFFPLGRGKKYGFESALVFIDVELYDAAVALSPAVDTLFAAMGVRSDDPYDLLVSHILPLHKGDEWKKSGFAALTGHLRYIKDKLAHYLASAEAHGKSRSQAIQLLREGIRIGTKRVTDQAWTFGQITSLYLAKEYMPSFCIETLVPDDVDETQLISASYLAAKAKDPDAEARSWREFLIEMGIRVSPAVVGAGSDWLPSKELKALLDSPLASTRKATLECLNVNWDSYSAKLSQPPQLVRGKVIFGATQFAAAIRGMQAPIKGRRKTVSLSDSYYPNAELTTLIGEALPYVDATLSTNMLDDCCVTHRVDANALLKRLRQLKGDGTGTWTQIQAIYRALDERFWSTSASVIRDAFESDGLIYLRPPHKGWYSPSQVTRRSNDPFLDRLYPPIQPSYKDFQRFFIDHLGVSKELPVANWVAALLKIDQIPDARERATQALAIYKRANKELAPRFGQEVPVPDWIATFQDEAVYVNQRGQLVANDEFLFANDRPEIAALFMDDEELSFVSIDPSDVPRLTRLLDAAGVERLSTWIETHVLDAEEGVVNDVLTHRIIASVPHFARYLYAKQPQAFDAAIEAQEFSTLWKTTVREVSTLNLTVDLGDFSRETKAEAAFDDDGRILYLAGTRVLRDRIASLISHRLLGSSELGEAFARILYDDGDGGIDDLFEVWNVQPLPDDLAQAVDAQRFGRTAAAQSSEDGVTANVDDPTSELQATISAAGTGAEPGEDATTSSADTEHEATQSDEPPASDNRTAISTKGGPSQGQPRSPKTLGPQPGTGSTSPASPGPSPLGGTAAPAGGTRSATLRPPATDSRGSGDSSTGVSPTSTQQGSPFSRFVTPSGTPRPPAPGDGSAPLRESTPSVAGPNPFDGARSTSTPKPRGGRLLSYVEPAPSNDDGLETPGVEQTAARDAIARAAVDYFLQSQAWRWKSLEEMPHFNPGYDVRAVAHSGEEEYVEVKGQSGAWSYEGIVMTPTELETAKKMGQRFWLCVVEFAQDEKRHQLHLVRAPFDRISQFRFDMGWKAAAESISAAPQIPREGLYIDIEGVGVGRIASLTSGGTFFKVTVNLREGRQVSQVFNPAKMKLSEEPLWRV